MHAWERNTDTYALPFLTYIDFLYICRNYIYILTFLILFREVKERRMKCPLT